VKAKFARDHGIHEDGLLVPIGIHGDGVPFQKKSSLELISWNLCCIEGSERNLFGSIEKQDLCDCGCYGRHTLDAMLEIFVWSTQALLTGQFPNKRHDSTECGGERRRQSRTLRPRLAFQRVSGPMPGRLAMVQVAFRL